MNLKRLERFAPPGFPIKTELILFAASLVPGILFSLTFFVRYVNYYGDVYAIRMYPEYELFAEEVYWMPTFRELMGTSLGHTFFLFGLAFATIFGILAYHYASYVQGSKSVYLMRRLKRKTEWHVRAIALPLMEIVVTFVIMGFLWLIFYAFYYLVTPAEWIR